MDYPQIAGEVTRYRRSRPAKPTGVRTTGDDVRAMWTQRDERETEELAASVRGALGSDYRPNTQHPTPAPYHVVLVCVVIALTLASVAACRRLPGVSAQSAVTLLMIGLIVASVCMASWVTLALLVARPDPETEGGNG